MSGEAPIRGHNPSVVAIDFETTSDGGGLYVAHPSFRVLSVAIAYREGAEIRSEAFTGSNVERVMRELAASEVPLAAHNLQYEMSVAARMWPNLKLNWAHDTMFLAAMADSGAEKLKFAPVPAEFTFTPELAPKAGLGLEKVASRFLAVEHRAHKSVMDEELKRVGGMANLAEVDEAVLLEYNRRDAETTLRLLEVLPPCNTMAWPLILNRLKAMVQAYLDGIAVDVEKLTACVASETRKLADLESKAESDWRSEMEQAGMTSINFGSSKQKKSLLFDVANLAPVAMTPKGLQAVKDGLMTEAEALSAFPSTGTKALPKDPRTEAMRAMGSTKLVINQALSVYLAVMSHGRLHPNIRGIGTVSYRVAGGS